MGVERTLNKEKPMKLIAITASRVVDKDKETLKNIFLNANNEEETKKEDLKSLFILWSKYLPQHQQNFRCGSCRNAVWAFWYKINESYKK